MITTQTAALVAEVERLTECLRYEQHRAGRRGTHGTDCYKWGPEHYECAMRQVERLTNQASVLSAAVDRTEKELAEAKADAERYQWLRCDRSPLNGAPFVCINTNGMFSRWTGIAADENIDAAMLRTDAGATTG